MTMAQRLKHIAQRIVFFLSFMGPGLITASAGNDAPGIATYSMVGSVYGYDFLWILLWVAVGAIFVQEMSASANATASE